MSRHVKSQLSAYLDGRTDNPAAIERHLRDCPACRAYLDKLKALSARLRALPEPDARPEFLTRVMSQVREIRQERRAPWVVRFVVPMAAVAGVILVLSALLRLNTSPTQRSVPMVAKNGLTTAGVASLTDDEVPTSDELISTLSREDWFASLEQEWERETDIESLVDTLTAEELQTFEKLLRTYQKEDAPI